MSLADLPSPTSASHKTTHALRQFLDEAYVIFSKDHVYLNREYARWPTMRSMCSQWLQESTIYHFAIYLHRSAKERGQEDALMDTLSQEFEEVEQHMMEMENVYLHLIKEPRSASPRSASPLEGSRENSPPPIRVMAIHPHP